MTIDQLVHHFAGWLDSSGEYSEIVISSRARLARNLDSVPFASRASEAQLSQVLNNVLAARERSNYLKDIFFIDISQLSKIDRQILVERHLISPGLAEGKDQHQGILLDEQELVSVMVNEEDHLRLQAMQSGLQLQEVWALVDKFDDEFSRLLDYSFSEKLGYLTACPSNVGTGLRISVLIHLPALVLTREIEKVLRAITQVGMTVRGFYGEGTEVLGNFFQISNQVTLGKSEEQIIGSLKKIVTEVIESELKSRQTLINDARYQLEDKIWRALGILENARLLTTEEFMNLCSAVRLGRSMELIPYPDFKTLNQLIVMVQPSHLQKLAGRYLESSERDIFRANIVRERLQGAKTSQER
ncbi:MAG: protein arginine kinase [Candidatus Latescibacteria bacterium]|nr:protein arginine kinase [Candidatus Latescibacterota bacterium]